MKKIFIALLAVSLFQNSFGKEVFNITSHKKIVIEKGDITKSHTQAIVNAANEDLMGGAGVCGAIFKAAGWNQLQNACNVYKKKGSTTCSTGQARITDSFDLKKYGIQYIIHAVGPDCRIVTDEKTQNDLLRKSYESSLKLAEDYELTSIAFPFISSAIYAFPKERASKIALDTCINMLQDLAHVQEVHFVLFSLQDYDLFVKTIKKLMK